MGVPMGVIMAPGTLRTPELGNHWVNSLRIKFIGTVFDLFMCNVMIIYPWKPHRRAHRRNKGS